MPHISLYILSCSYLICLLYLSYIFIIAHQPGSAQLLTHDIDTAVLSIRLSVMFRQPATEIVAFVIFVGIFLFVFWPLNFSLIVSKEVDDELVLNSLHASNVCNLSITQPQIMPLQTLDDEVGRCIENVMIYRQYR